MGVPRRVDRLRGALDYRLMWTFVIGALTAIGLLVGSYWAGGKNCRASREVEIAQMQATIDAEKARQAQVTEKVVIEYRDRVKIVKEKGDAIEKLVPVYVPANDLAPAFRMLHDAAASGQVPDSAERAIAAAKPIEGVAYASTVAENYKSCRAASAQLVALQKWTVEQAGGASAP